MGAHTQTRQSLFFFPYVNLSIWLSLLRYFSYHCAIYIYQSTQLRQSSPFLWEQTHARVDAKNSIPGPLQQPAQISYSPNRPQAGVYNLVLWYRPISLQIRFNITHLSGADIQRRRICMTWMACDRTLPVEGSRFTEQCVDNPYALFGGRVLEAPLC